MSEEIIKQHLIEKFGQLQDKVFIKRARRMFVEVDMKDFRPILEFAVNHLKFPILSGITGLDEQERFGIIYHLAQEKGIMLNIKTFIPKADPILQSITPIFSSAEIYEREMADLFGIKVQGLQPGERYPLPDDWPKDQFPLRKGWTSDVLDKEDL